VVAAQFGEIPAGNNAELGRKRLKQHRDDVGEEHHPQQAVTVFGAGLYVGGKISRIHVRDRGNDRGAAEGDRGAQPAGTAGERLRGTANGAPGQRGSLHLRLEYRRIGR
jgi:hypothetical protein